MRDEIIDLMNELEKFRQKIETVHKLLKLQLETGDNELIEEALNIIEGKERD